MIDSTQFTILLTRLSYRNELLSLILGVKNRVRYYTTRTTFFKGDRIPMYLMFSD